MKYLLGFAQVFHIKKDMKKQFLFYPFLNRLGSFFVPGLIFGLVFGLVFGFGLTGCSSQMNASPVFSLTPDSAPSRSFSTLMEDSIISTRIKTKMISDDFVKAGPIDVDVYNGVAYLKGTVETDSQKRMTGDLVRGVEGVVRVENHLLVK